MPRGWSRSVIRQGGFGRSSREWVLIRWWPRHSGARLVGVVWPVGQGSGGRCRRARPGDGAAGEAAVPVAARTAFDPVGDRVGLGAHVDQLPGGGVGDQQLPAGVLTQCQGAGVVGVDRAEPGDAGPGVAQPGQGVRG